MFLSLFLQFCPVFAAQKGGIEYDDYFFDLTKIDTAQIQYEADNYFTMATQAQTKEDRDKYIDAAQVKYYILTLIDKGDMESIIQLARIYDYKNKNRIAKEYFYRATNIDEYNPHANYYFGDFYYKRNDYKRALRFYNVAYRNGLSEKYDLNYNLGIIHEKLADLVNAKKFYEISFSLNPENRELQEKINSINELNYDKSEYYHIIRE